MTRNTIVGTCAGLVIGVLVGFYGANYLNRNNNDRLPAPPADTPSSQPANRQSPPNQAGMMGDVQATLDNAKNNPKDPAAQIKAGDLYLEIQRFDEALNFYARAVELDPNSYEANANLGQIYFKKKEFEKAGTYYEKALGINKLNPGLRNDLGLTFYLREPADTKRAVEEYKKALELDPNNELALQNLSVALKDMGNSKELAETLNRLKQVNPKNEAIQKLTAN